MLAVRIGLLHGQIARCVKSFRWRCNRALWTSLDPVDQVTPLWTIKTGLQGGLGFHRIRCLWMSEGLMLLQLDPLDHPFDPEGQAPTLWVRTIEPQGSEGRRIRTTQEA